MSIRFNRELRHVANWWTPISTDEGGILEFLGDIGVGINAPDYVQFELRVFNNHDGTLFTLLRPAVTRTGPGRQLPAAVDG